MTETIEKRAVTWKQYAALPDDGKRYQVVEGELIVAPAPTSGHQRTIGRLFAALHAFVEANDLGEVLLSPIDVILSKTNVVQPDILFIAKRRLRIIKDQITGPPDLVVEILSPKSARLDTVRKLDLYARFGVPHYWILNLDERVVICYRLAGKKYERVGLYEGEDRFTHELFKGLTIELATLWPKR
jgi:Uma2 family endonuclease